MARSGALVLLTTFAAMPLLSEPISGRVVDRQSSAPLGSAQVKIRKAGAATLLADLDTDGSGQFRGPDLTSGDYTIEVSKSNYIPATLHLQSGAAPATGLTISLVHYGVIAGIVTDQQGKPVRGVRVFAIAADGGRPVSGGAPRDGQNNAETDDAGRFRLFRLTAGEYLLGAAWEPASGIGANFAYLQEGSRARMFRVTAGEEFRDIGFTLSAAPMLSVSGHVELPSPDARFGVALLARDRPEVLVGHFLTQSDGKFHFDGIPPGAYDLIAAGPFQGYGSRAVIVGPDAVFGRVPVQLSGAPVEDVAIPLANGRAATLILRADADATGCPATAQVRLTPLEDNGVLAANPVDLQLNMPKKVTGLAPSRYQADIAPAGGCFQRDAPAFDVTASDFGAPIVLTMQAAGSIVGTIDAPDNRGPYEVIVVPLGNQSRDSTIRSVYADASRHFSLAGLPPGRYRISARTAGPSREATAEVNVAGGGVPTAVTIAAPSN